MPHLLYNLLMFAADFVAIRHKRLLAGGLLNTGLALLVGMLGIYRWDWQIFGLMQSLSWLLFVHVPILLLASRRTRLLALPLLVVGVDAFLIEPHWLVVRQHTIPVQGLTEPVRVGLVADIQTDRVGAHEHQALARLMAAAPDLVLFSGDYIQLPDGDRFDAAVAALHPALAAISPPLGAFAVQGDIDQGNEWPRVFADTPITPLLETRSIDVGPLVITGLSLAHSRHPAPPIPNLDTPHLVFGHSPDFANAQPPADLLLAGHTHGGQVQLPLIGPLLTLSEVPREWASGALVPLSQGGFLRVSRGIGMERAHAPRLRFLCRPEVVILDLQPAPRLNTGSAQTTERPERP